MPNERGLTEFVTFFGQFLDHTIVATPENFSEPFNIQISRDDAIFGNFSGFLPFHRSVRAKLERRKNDERPINSLSSAVDLASVYGVDYARTADLRSNRGGRLKVTSTANVGDLLPMNTNNFRNSPSNSSTFFLAGDHRANEHPVLTSIHTLFLREHNQIADKLAAAFPDYSDEELFQWARKVNIAQFQKIVFEEFVPAITGRTLPHYAGYIPSTNPTVSDLFSTAAYRVGHTMVGNGIHRRDVGMKYMPKISMTDMFFRRGELMTKGVEPFLRGAVYHAAQEIDIFVTEALRNFLFTKVPHEIGFDLIALNIQRGRDHGIPTYNEVRLLVGRKAATKFRQITSNLAVQSKLATIYGHPDRVEAWPGLMAEDHMRGSSLGKTLYKVWRNEFVRLRNGDQFYFRVYRTFPRHILKALPQLRRMLIGRETMREIMLRNSNISKEELGKSVWKISHRYPGAMDSPSV